MNEPTLIDTKTSEADRRAKAVADTCRGLRQAADFFEQHPECLGPWPSFTLNCLLPTKEKLVEVTRGLGKLEKKAAGEHFWLQKNLPGDVRIDLFVRRDQVCEKVVTKKTLPAEPETVIKIEAKPEREVEEVSWVCPDSLLAESAQ